MGIIENLENVQNGVNNDHNDEHILCFKQWLFIMCRSFTFFSVLNNTMLPHKLLLTMENYYLPSSSQRSYYNHTRGGWHGLESFNSCFGPSSMSN